MATASTQPETGAAAAGTEQIAQTEQTNVEQTGETATANAETAQTGEQASAVTTENVQTEETPVEVSASFVSIASNEMKENSVDVNYVGSVQNEPTWVAFHNGVPFAKAVASAAENKATFADPSFGRAFKAIAAEQGVQAAIEQLRFEEIKPVVQIAQVVAEQIQTQVSEQGAVLAEASAKDQSELAERFRGALATAAHGINTGYFRDTSNPILTALASTLESIGLEGAEDLLQRAFLDHSPEYHAAILAKAGEIMKYDAVVQNQMATAVTQIEPKNVVATASSSLSMGRPVQRPVQVQKQESELATASAQQSQPSNFKSKLTGLKLFR
uniref:ATPase n=1 Tax=Pseudomonas phage HRDY3 TaxID=3236930 RepID=A0AB39CEI3_9VIRU